VQERFTAALATFAAALTVLLACMGVYGMLAYSVGDLHHRRVDGQGRLGPAVERVQVHLRFVRD
jgi:hypothetical protein